MRIVYDSYTQCGKRLNNEDALTVIKGPYSVLAIACDGVGGHEYGEVASSQTIKVICNKLIDKKPFKYNLEEAIYRAHEEISKVKRHGMTTLAIAWIGERNAYIANVGDTRIYQFRDGRIIYQSLDHSVAQLAVFTGEIESSGIRTHPKRNQLTRVIGGDDFPRFDIVELFLEKDDRLLLCTDGFWNEILESEMEHMCLQCDSLKKWLVKMRNQVSHNASDNNTAIAIQVLD